MPTELRTKHRIDSRTVRNGIVKLGPPFSTLSFTVAEDDKNDTTIISFGMTIIFSPDQEKKLKEALEALG